MSGWELSLYAPPSTDLDAAGLSILATCDDLDALLKVRLIASQPDVSMLVGDLFQVQKRSDDRVVIHGDLRRLHRIGYGWTYRSLQIEGDVGIGLGTQMCGGQILLRGNTLGLAGCQMRGGFIQISGHTGDCLAGPLPGRRSGMSGGRIVVMGNAGHQAGHRMRRGTLIIVGDTKDGAASDVVAGTIAIGGRLGDFVAAGMRRGTLILRKGTPLDPVRFSAPREVDLGICRLVADDLQRDIPEIAAALRAPLQRSLGDRSGGGQGEVWFF